MQQLLIMAGGRSGCRPFEKEGWPHVMEPRALIKDFMGGPTG